MTTQPVAPTAAALAIVAGMMTLGLTDNFVPYVTEHGSLWQFHLLRGAMALAMMLCVAAFGFGTLRPNRVLPVAARSIFQAGAMLIYFGCLAFLPIGVVVAGLFTAPLFTVLIGLFFQGKQVGVIRWSAIIIGFVGAMLVIRPDPAALDPIAFLPIIAGLLYAIGAVATRTWCEGEPTLALTAGFFIMLTTFGAIGCLLLPGTGMGAEGFPLRGWTPMTSDRWFWIAVQSVGALVGIAFIFRGYQLGEASFVAVFEYSLLIFATVWAFILWDETVPITALIGMGLIAAAGTIIAMRPDR